MYLRDRWLLLGVPLMRQPRDSRGNPPGCAGYAAIALWLWILAPAVIWFIFG